MKTNQQHHQPVAPLNFRQWSRKGYAVFASLGKSVRIATLKTAISEGVGGKSDAAVNPLQLQLLTADAGDLQEPVDDISLTLNNSFLSSLLMTIVTAQPTVAACDDILSHHYNKNPVGIGRQGFFVRSG